MLEKCRDCSNHEECASDSIEIRIYGKCHPTVEHVINRIRPLSRRALGEVITKYEALAGTVDSMDEQIDVVRKILAEEPCTNYEIMILGYCLLDVDYTEVRGRYQTIMSALGAVDMGEAEGNA